MAAKWKIAENAYRWWWAEDLVFKSILRIEFVFHCPDELFDSTKLLLGKSGFKDTYLAVSGDMMLEGAVGNESSVMYSDVWNGTQTEVDEQEFNDAVKEYLEGNETEYIRYRDLKYSIDWWRIFRVSYPCYHYNFIL